MSNQTAPSTHLDELRDLLNDSTRRARMLDILGLAALLEGCIIDVNYRVSDSWIRPIVFTELGDKVVSELLSVRKRMKPNDAKMAVFLQIGCADGLFVGDDTDLDALCLVLTQEMNKRQVQFPYIFGRMLHDKIVAAHPNKVTLSNVESIAILRQMPQGVFQVGHLVTGPFGCLLSTCIRQMPPGNGVPGYLCSDETCSAIHLYSLSTGRSSVSKAKSLLDEHIHDNYATTEDQHPRLFIEALYRDIEPFRRCTPDGIFEMFSDALTVDELREIDTELVKRRFLEEDGKASLARQLSRVLTSPSALVKELDQSALLQLAMLFTDKQIIAAVDAAIDSGSISLDDYEIRTRKISRWGDPVAAEVGTLGIRFTSTSSRFVAQRLSNILHAIFYAQDHPLDAQDLAYALELPADASAMVCLDTAVRDKEPSEFLAALCAHRQAAQAVCTELGLELNDTVSRSEQLDRVLWKLGVPSRFQFGDLEQIAEHHALLTGAMATGDTSEDVIRGHGVNLFTKLEDALQRAILFSCWALTVDHYQSPGGFTYDPHPNFEMLRFICDRAPVDEAFELKSNGRNSLGPLGSSFSRLGKALSALDQAEYLRPDAQLPIETRLTGRPFFFASMVPYLNLTRVSQQDILEALTKISRLIQDETLLSVRNGMMHGNAAFPTFSEIRLGLDRIAQCCDLLASTGLYPQVFRLIGVHTDIAGKTELGYQSERGSISITGPSWSLTDKLPTGNPHLVVVAIADLGSAGKLRFTLKRRPGPDTYWDGWPSRKRSSLGYGRGERAGPIAEDRQDVSLTG